MGKIDPSRLGQWYDAYAAAMVLYARQFAGPAAEDVVQEAFISLLAQSREPENVKAWLFRTVRNGAISHLRSHHRRNRREQAVIKSRWFITTPEELIDAATAQEAMNRLPGELREVVVLKIWAGMGFAEIGEITSRPISTVYDQYKAALAALRERMQSVCEKKIH